jgi:hypothetical protein
VAGADVILVSQGPGNAGTGTELGFSGLSVVEALHAADYLGGEAILIPRLSADDGRARHRGVSHHTRTILGCLRAAVVVPVPAVPSQAFESGSGHRVVVESPEPVWPALEACRELVTTMGRGLDQDPVFFRTAAAAGQYAARRAIARTTRDP